MRKYDLEAIPVVDNDGVLLGRITIDDVVDIIKELKDYKIQADVFDILQKIKNRRWSTSNIKNRASWCWLNIFFHQSRVCVCAEQKSHQFRIDTRDFEKFVFH